MTNLPNKTLSEIVLADNHAAPVFQKFNLNYCCNGKKTLETVCAEKNISVALVINELQNAANKFRSGNHLRFEDMSAAQLIVRLLDDYHYFVRQSVPQIMMHLTKLLHKHADHFEWITEGYGIFALMQEELLLHMQKEENVLFPYIIELEKTYKEQSHTEKIKNITYAIALRGHEHEEMEKLRDRMRIITNNYTPEEAACTTHRITLAELKEFDDKLNEHVYIEDKILFPTALRIYEELTREV